LFPRLRGPVDDMLALGESIAHLSWMRHEGLLQRVLDDDGEYRFSLTKTLTPQKLDHLNFQQASIRHARH